jgi:hypothetical protein
MPLASPADRQLNCRCQFRRPLVLGLTLPPRGWRALDRRSLGSALLLVRQRTAALGEGLSPGVIVAGGDAAKLIRSLKRETLDQLPSIPSIC